MNLFPSAVQAPGVVLLRRYADQVTAGELFFIEAAGELYHDLGGQLTRAEVEALLLTEVSDLDAGDGWYCHPSLPTMTKLLNATI